MGVGASRRHSSRPLRRSRESLLISSQRLAVRARDAEQSHTSQAFAHPLFNVTMPVVRDMMRFFYGQTEVL